MERNIMKELTAWRNKKAGRMPLILHGVRQAGKTYILRELGERCFKNCVYVNFERMEVISGFFEGELNPDRLIRLLEEYFSVKIVPDETLIIFDEIQA
ncbi:MAG: AAA family ATPase, partial [Lachnospiraceae bacterium]|nr:AAA family ATPase [Lachnospiraceae bacterium]